MRKVSILIIVAIFLLFSACTQGSGAAQTVEDYYQALVDKNIERAISLSCADWESNARMEADSFAGVDARLDEFSCEQTGVDGDNVFVRCKGKIVMSYNGEEQFIDLSNQTFLVKIWNGGAFFCGYR